MFYFAADTEDSLNAWLDAIKRATLGTERTSGIFTETDESDSEHKSKPKGTSDAKAFAEKTFGSLKKFDGSEKRNNSAKRLSRKPTVYDELEEHIYGVMQVVKPALELKELLEIGTRGPTSSSISGSKSAEKSSRYRDITMPRKAKKQKLADPIDFIDLTQDSPCRINPTVRISNRDSTETLSNDDVIMVIDDTANATCRNPFYSNRHMFQ
ncbi:unnamed protein product [Trichogramma brassicae]|uniref:PH domain-containing protein n=1 Tax=Trichogramma brassicae TaxID=86971 RepID=A0A6H5IZI0_9HYME|nr:unnamed protein product [Trichogramma brassicae]